MTQKEERLFVSYFRKIAEKTGVMMPRFYDQKIDQYIIKASPLGRIRPFLFRIGFRPPYFVGDKIGLKIKAIENLEVPQTLDTTISVGGQYPDAYTENQIIILPEKDIPIESRKSKSHISLIPEIMFEPNIQIIKSGEASIYVRKTTGKDKDVLLPIFVADMRTNDNFKWTVLLPFYLVVLGIISSAIFFILGHLWK